MSVMRVGNMYSNNHYTYLMVRERLMITVVNRSVLEVPVNEHDQGFTLLGRRQNKTLMRVWGVKKDFIKQKITDVYFPRPEIEVGIIYLSGKTYYLAINAQQLVTVKKGIIRLRLAHKFSQLEPLRHFPIQSLAAVWGVTTEWIDEHIANKHVQLCVPHPRDASPSSRSADRRSGRTTVRRQSSRCLRG